MAKQQAELEKQKQLELAKTEQQLKAEAERKAAEVKKEKELALAKAEQERLGRLGQNSSRTRQLELRRRIGKSRTRST